MKSQFVLLVEDAPDEALLLQDLCKRCGMAESTFKILPGGREAMEYLEQTAAQQKAELLPTLIVLDLVMPDVNGLRLLAWIRSHLDLMDVPVYFLTWHVSQDIRDQAFEWGCTGFLNKMDEMPKLMQLLSSLDGSNTISSN